MKNKVVSDNKGTGKSSKAVIALQSTIDENNYLLFNVDKYSYDIAKTEAAIAILKKWNELSVSTKIELIENGQKPVYADELNKVNIKIETPKAKDDDSLEGILKRNKTLKEQTRALHKTLVELEAQLKAAKAEFDKPISKLVKELETELDETETETKRLRNRPVEVRVEHVPYSEPEREFQWGVSKYSCCEAPVD